MNLAVYNPNFSIVVPSGCNAACKFCFWEQSRSLSKEEFLQRLEEVLLELPEDFEQCSITGGVPVRVGNRNLRTSEVLQDDGTYGSSMEYLYWWNTAGVGHKHYVTGGQIVHISEQPLSVKSIIINMELATE